MLHGIWGGDEEGRPGTPQLEHFGDLLELGVGLRRWGGVQKGGNGGTLRPVCLGLHGVDPAG